MNQNKHESNFLPLIVIGILFFTFGFITWTNGTLIPFLKIVCDLKTDIEAFFVTFAFYISYLVIAIPSSFVLKKVGFRNGMILGLLITSLGSLIFILAARSRGFDIFLLALFVQGAGLALLQTAVNPYVSILGPIESAAKRISMMGIANKFAGILAPIIMGAIVLKNSTDIEKQLNQNLSIQERNEILDLLASRVNTPYLILTILLIFVAILIYLARLPEVKEISEVARPNDIQKNVLAYPHLVLGLVAIFCYTGAEVIAGDGIIQYGKNIGISLDISKNFTAYTLSCMLIGYLIGIFAIPKYLSQEKALTISAIVGLTLTIIIIFTTGHTAVYGIAGLGLANALMWPVIFPLSIKGLGRFTKTGSAILIMGVSGGAVLPLIYAGIGGKSDPQDGFWVLVFCYGYILYFALKGFKIKSW